jgi:hypothetical protein
VERTVGGRFRMFMDLDVEAPAGTRPADDEAHVMAVVRCVLRGLPAVLRRGDIVVCLRQAGGVVDPATDASADAKRKCGAHLVWGEVWVDAATAVAARDDVVKACGQLAKMSGLVTATTWARIVDAAVYRNSGLRMAFSCKRRPAGDASFYTPCFTVDDARTAQVTRVEPRPDPFLEPAAGLAAWLRRVSLHAPEPPPSDGVDGVDNEDGVDGVDAEYRREDCGGTAGWALGGDRTPVVWEGGSGGSGSVAQKLLPAVYAELPPVYACCVLTPVPSASSEGGGAVTFGLAGSRFCHVAGGEHKSNRVYVVVTREGVFQRCHCRCPGKPCAVPGAQARLSGARLLPEPKAQAKAGGRRTRCATAESVRAPDALAALTRMLRALDTTG